MSPGWKSLFGEGSVVIDGGLSTQLELHGHDVSGPLWTAHSLLSDPTVVERAHRDFIDAGARVIITSSYQISRSGFAGQGFSADDADAALAASTRVAQRAAAGTNALVAASVGPYGATLHDGSEYRGNYGLAAKALKDFHAERLEVLLASEPDLLAIETIPDVREAEAVIAALDEAALDTMEGLAAWMSFSCKDDAHTCAGQSIEEAVSVAVSHPSIAAIGVNCTDPQVVRGLIERMSATTDLPIVVYANAGGTWDAPTRAWSADHVNIADFVGDWMSAGATAIGGCCGTSAEDIRLIATALTR